MKGDIYVLAIFVSNCMTPTLHFLIIVIQTGTFCRKLFFKLFFSFVLSIYIGELLWITDNPSYLSPKNYTRRPDILYSDRIDAKRTLTEFLIIHGLVYNPDEGSKLAMKNKFLFNAAQAMYKSATNHEEVTSDEIADLRRGIARADGLQKVLNHMILGFLEAGRKELGSGQVVSSRNCHLHVGYVFEETNSDASDKLLTIYFVLEVSFSLIKIIYNELSSFQSHYRLKVVLIS
jgi:hypothetical protein